MKTLIVMINLKKVVTLPNHFTNPDANEFHALLDVFGKHYFRDKDIKNYDFFRTLL